MKESQENQRLKFSSFVLCSQDEDQIDDDIFKAQCDQLLVKVYIDGIEQTKITPVKAYINKYEFKQFSIDQKPQWEKVKILFAILIKNNKKGKAEGSMKKCKGQSVQLPVRKLNNGGSNSQIEFDVEWGIVNNLSATATSNKVNKEEIKNDTEPKHSYKVAAGKIEEIQNVSHFGIKERDSKKLILEIPFFQSLIP